ncbi:hypothetical protein MMC20_002684 [Loxospora ochrophaea]|nr:hypothetical protein [Loxospora ochrophaea]
MIAGNRPFDTPLGPSTLQNRTGKLFRSFESEIAADTSVQHCPRKICKSRTKPEDLKRRCQGTYKQRRIPQKGPCMSFEEGWMPRQSADSDMAGTELLRTAAETARDIASAFHRFLDRLPEHEARITALIADLFSISSNLIELKTAADEYPEQSYRYANRIRILRRSIEYTFIAIRRLFGGLGRQIYRTERERYSYVWREIESYFRYEETRPLFQRLQDYDLVLQGLTQVIDR